MTDKQIIDGIDVRDCCKWYSLPDGKLYCRINNKRDFTCKSNPDCQFKQLARAKDKINYMEEYIKTVENARNDLERELEQKEQECERLKWYLEEIRDDELKTLDIEWDEYETHSIDTEYSNIINLVEEALEERNSEDCRYGK